MEQCHTNQLTHEWSIGLVVGGASVKFKIQAKDDDILEHIESSLQNEKHTFLKYFSRLQHEKHVFEAIFKVTKWKTRFQAFFKATKWETRFWSTGF